ncbi:unnamed protein product [Calypogeia fissa]
MARQGKAAVAAIANLSPTEEIKGELHLEIWKSGIGRPKALLLLRNGVVLETRVSCCIIDLELAAARLSV